MSWKLENIKGDDIGKVVNFFEEKNFKEIHGIFKDKGVYPAIDCQVCENHSEIKKWVMYGIMVTWKEEINEGKENS